MVGGVYSLIMLSDASPTLAARRSARRARVQYLVTADEHALADLAATVAGLPLCATGRIFVEVPDASWIAPLSAPTRMTVTWLDRSRRSGAPGTAAACGQGTALARAVIAWATEAIAAPDDATRFVLLGSYVGTADIVDHLTERIGVDASAIHTPARFGLPTAG